MQVDETPGALRSASLVLSTSSAARPAGALVPNTFLTKASSGPKASRDVGAIQPLRRATSGHSSEALKAREQPDKEWLFPRARAQRCSSASAKKGDGDLVEAAQWLMGVSMNDHG